MSETDTKVHFSHILVIFFRVSGRSATFHTSYTHIHINILTIHPITTRTVLLYFSLYYRNCTKTYLRILGRIDQSKCCTAHQTNHLTPLLWHCQLTSTQTPLVATQSEDLRDLLDYSIFFTNYFLTNESEPTTLGPSFQQFHNEFNSTIIEDDIVFDSFTTMVVAIQLYEEQYGTTLELIVRVWEITIIVHQRLLTDYEECLYELKFQGKC